MTELFSLFHSSIWGTILQVIGAIASVVALSISLLIALLQFELLPLTWGATVRAAKRLIRKVKRDNWNPDFVICLGRSGGMWGGFVAGNLGSVPASMVMDNYAPHSSYVEFDFAKQCFEAVKSKGAKRVLVVQGYSGTGGTFFAFRELISKHPSLNPIEFRYASVFAWSGCRFTEQHYVGRTMRKPQKEMPWHVSQNYVTAMGDN